MRTGRERLLDILEAADRIAERVARGRQRFDDDEDTRLAIVHLLEILGEAAASVSPATQALAPHLRWRGPAAMRNRLIHGYFDVDANLVWHAAAQFVPGFAAGVRQMVDTLPCATYFTSSDSPALVRRR